MPFIWYYNTQSAKNPGWKAVPVADTPMVLDGGLPRDLEADAPLPDGAVVLSRADDARWADTWVLVWGVDRSVRVNGLIQGTGIKVINDRDEIGVGDSEPVFFSTESPARVESFQSGDHDTFCPRCKKVIEADTPVVRCPVCSLAYHYSEDPDHDCFGFSPKCACGHPTNMDGTFQWWPEEVWE
jgi:hypothetical protein